VALRRCGSLVINLLRRSLSAGNPSSTPTTGVANQNIANAGDTGLYCSRYDMPSDARSIEDHIFYSLVRRSIDSVYHDVQSRDTEVSKSFSTQLK